MTGRVLLAQALGAALEGWQIVADARVLDSVKRPGACVLWTSKRQRLSDKGTGWYLDEVTLWVLTATDKPDQLEDDLDALLMAATEALEPLDAFHWESAERGNLNDRFDGYRLTVSCVFHTEPETEPETEEN